MLAYIVHEQYIRAHVAVSKAQEKARVKAAGDMDKYFSLLQEEHLPSPELYFRRAVSIASWTLCLFCGAAVCGLAAQRWIAVVLTFLVWILALVVTGTRI